MRLRSFEAANTQQAMAALRAAMGDQAVIVATQTLSHGGIRVTGAVDQDELDLAALLDAAASPPARAQLAAMATFHELAGSWPARLDAALGSSMAGEPAAALAEALRRLYRFMPTDLEAPQAWLLAGPPGAGKTATLAKLAARAVLAGRSVTVATCDLERAGGLAPLQALLEPIGVAPVPFKEPDELAALQAGHGSLMLIDTPGLNLFRAQDVGVLSRLLPASGAELLPVLPAEGGAGNSGELAHVCAALGAKRFIATKLDAARRLGALLAAADAGLAFAEAGIGPTIGSGIAVLTPDGLARLLWQRHCDHDRLEEATA